MKINNTKTVGGISQSLCVAYLSSLGHIVSQPLFDNARYDLISDDGKSLQRIQCKTAYNSKSKTGNDYYSVKLGCNRYGAGKQKRYDDGDFDLLWIVAGKSYYLIPIADLSKDSESLFSGFKLSGKYNTYKIIPDFSTGASNGREPLVSPLSDSEKDRIVSLYQSGESAHSIALTMGLTTSKVSSFLTSQGVKHQNYYLTDNVKERIATMYTAGESSHKIASEVGFSLSSVRRAIQELDIVKQVRVLTDEKRLQIVQMYRKGMKCSEIAKVLEIPSSSVDGFVRKNKWAIENHVIASGET